MLHDWLTSRECVPGDAGDPFSQSPSLSGDGPGWPDGFVTALSPLAAQHPLRPQARWTNIHGGAAPRQTHRGTVRTWGAVKAPGLPASQGATPRTGVSLGNGGRSHGQCTLSLSLVGPPFSEFCSCLPSLLGPSGLPLCAAPPPRPTPVHSTPLPPAPSTSGTPLPPPPHGTLLSSLLVLSDSQEKRQVAPWCFPPGGQVPCCALERRISRDLGALSGSGGSARRPFGRAWPVGRLIPKTAERGSHQAKGDESPLGRRRPPRRPPVPSLTDGVPRINPFVLQRTRGPRREKCRWPRPS